MIRVQPVFFYKRTSAVRSWDPGCRLDTDHRVLQQLEDAKSALPVPLDFSGNFEGSSAIVVLQVEIRPVTQELHHNTLGTFQHGDVERCIAPVVLHVEIRPPLQELHHDILVAFPFPCGLVEGSHPPLVLHIGICPAAQELHHNILVAFPCGLVEGSAPAAAPVRVLRVGIRPATQELYHHVLGTCRCGKAKNSLAVGDGRIYLDVFELAILGC